MYGIGNLKVFKQKNSLSYIVPSQMSEYAINREKWFIVLLLIIVVIVVVSSVLLYGPHWIKGFSAFI